MTDSAPKLNSLGSHHRSYLVRCDSCGRSQKASPGEILAGIRSGGVACCGRQMELYVQTSWPTPSGVVAMPKARVPAG
jgi:hypothetical protein